MSEPADQDMLITLDHVRAYLWIELCRENLGGGEAVSPVGTLKGGLQ